MKRIRQKWREYWKDDTCDMEKRHLSQHDKRALLYGGFMVSALTFILISIVVLIGNLWANHQAEKDMEELLGTVSTYMATATDDEYEEIAQTIRHDHIYSEYGQDVENLIQYVPNTADGCCLEREGYLERINLVFLNTGETYGLDIYQANEPITDQKNRGTIANFGYDEISESHVTIIKNLSTGTGSAAIDRSRGIVSLHKMKAQFCDDCIREILDVSDNEGMNEAVIYDAEEKTFFPIINGDLEIGDYSFHTAYEDSTYQIEIQYTGES